jgi:hypothetical protein
VRHALVQRIVRAYESAQPRQQELPLALSDAMEPAQPREEAAQGTTPSKPQ